MKKISRTNLQGLRQRFPELTKNELVSCIGGNGSPLNELESNLIPNNEINVHIGIEPIEGIGGNSEGEILSNNPKDNFSLLGFVGSYGSGPYDYFSDMAGSWYYDMTSGQYVWWQNPNYPGNEGGNGYPGDPWYPNGYPGYPWYPNGYPGYPWYPNGYPGYPWYPNGYPGYPWYPNGYPENPWNPDGYPGYPWYPNGYPGYPWYPNGYPELPGEQDGDGYPGLPNYDGYQGFPSYPGDYYG